MENKTKFKNFLESIKTDTNSTLIDNVVTGFDACYEHVMPHLGMGKDPDVIGGLSNNLPTSAAVLVKDDESACEVMPEESAETLPDAPEAAPEAQEAMVADIENFVELIKQNPEVKDAFLQALSR